MRLSPGTRLGAYEITAALGAGGMGEVYRARDTKLGRDVALKTLPDAFASAPDRLIRFEREARTLASLNHPSIAHVYGIEDSTAALALVMELVDGEDLSTRIRRGPIPLEDALPLARQIADALEAAHDHGIIHRDLKPGNVKVRPDGTVKVLDFGLAKALDPSTLRTGSAEPERPDQEIAAAIANSPTITSPAMTLRGVILGTAAYMAPEQAKGKGIDKRVDIWAFGCVLYEMLAGRRAFPGEDVTDTLTAVLRDPPDWSALPTTTPPAIRTLLRRCLEKSPSKRIGHISLARLEIDEFLASPDLGPPAVDRRAQRARLREAAAWTLATAGALAAAWMWLRPVAPPDASAPPGRYTIEIPWVTDSGTASFIALSPDGTSIAVQTSNTAAATPVYTRRIDAVGFTPIPGSDRFRMTSWSADGASFMALSRVGQAPASRESEIARVDITSGHARSIARFPGSLVPFTVVEGAGGVVLVGVAGQPVHVVTAAGERPTPVGTLDANAREVEQQSPVFLPDGRRFFYTSVREGNQLAARLRSLDSNEVQDLAGVDGRIVWADDRHVIFRRDGSLFAQALTFAPLALQGRPVIIADNAPVVSFLPRQPLAAATSTLLAYRTGTQVSQQFTWFGRDGRRLGTLGPEGTFSTFDLARDGARLIVSRNESVGMNLWVLDTATGAFNRVTSGTSTDLDPRASPDGRVAIFASTRDPARSPFRSSLSGQAPSERVFPFPGQVYSNDDWSADGRWLLYHDASVPVLYARRMDRTDEPPTVAARAIAGIIDQARMSRDGRWVAYNATESGRSEVYVVPFPPTGDRWQVSAAGGAQPLWGPKDRELYYLTLEGMLMVVPVKAAESFDSGRATRLFQSPLRSVSGDTEQYAVAPDGARFLFAPFTAPAKPDVVTVLTNWRSMVSQRRE